MGDTNSSHDIVSLIKKNTMKSFITVALLLITCSVWSQEQLLNQCIVLELASDSKTDLRKATFDLPFAAMRASEENEKKIVPHYAFDILSTDSKEDMKGDGLSVISMRSYEYGEPLADNEIAFFVMEWPEGYGVESMGPMLASFPSINGEAVTTDHLIFEKSFTLSEKLVTQLGLASNQLGPGHYRIERMDIEY